MSINWNKIRQKITTSTTQPTTQTQNKSSINWDKIRQKTFIGPVQQKAQPTTVKQPSTTPKNTAPQKPESMRMLDSFFKRETKQQPKQQNTNLTFTTKAKMKSDFDSNIKKMVGDEAYKALPKYGYLPGQQRDKQLTNLTDEELRQYKATQEWEKNHPEAAKKLKAYDMQIRANKGDFSGNAAAFTLGALDSISLGSISRTADKSGMVNPIKVAKEKNPVASTVGNGAGYLIPGGAAEKGAAAVTKPILKKVASKVGQSAVTGAVSGAGLAATEGVIRGEKPGEIAKNIILYGGLGAGTNAALTKIFSKFKTGQAITPEETETIRTVSKSNPEILQLPEVKQLLLAEKTTSKIELGPSKPTYAQPEPVTPKADFYATERSVAKNINDFKRVPEAQKLLPEGKVKTPSETGKESIQMVRKAVNLPNYDAKPVENPFAITKGETKFGNKKSGVKLPTNTDKLSNKIKAQIKANERINSGEYNNTIGQKYDVIKPSGTVIEPKNIYAATKGTKERPFVEVRGKQIADNATTQPLKFGTPSNKSMGILPKGFRLKANTEVPYVSETASKVKNTKDIKTSGNLWDKFYRNFVDSQKSIKDFSKAADQKGLKTDVLANNSRNVGGTVDYILREGLVDKLGKNIGESFKTIIDRVSRKQEKAFNDYMLHRHNVSRMNEGKPVFGEEVPEAKSLEEIKNYESAYPEFKQTAEMYDKFMNDFMDEWGVKSGLIDQDTWLKIKEKYPNYVPTYRVFSEVEKVGKGSGKAGRRFVNVSKIFNKAVGSERDIINPLEKTMELVDKTVKTAKYNEVGQSIVTALRDAPEELKGWAEIVTEPKQGLLDEINATLKDEGLEGLMDKFNQQFDQVFNKKPTGNNIVRVMENGKPVYLKVNDPEFLKAITGLTKSQSGEIEGFIRKYLTNPFKSLITGKNPIFAIKNISRDIPTAYINGSEKNPAKFLGNLAAAAKDMATDSQLYKEFRAIGGKHSSYFKNDLNNLYKGPGNLEKFNTFIESLPRFAEYRRTVLKGGNDYISKMQGLYNSAEVTTNFARHGDIAKSIDSFVPYFNPSVQGLDKLVRQFKNNKLATVGKGVAIVTIPAVALNIINNKLDPEGYKNLDNRTKDTYYVLSSGDGKFIKIPKTREYGALLGAFFERAIRTAKGEPEPFKGYGETLKTNFLPTFQNIAKPIITDIPSNKDFAGRTIVPGNLQNVSPRYQYDENTTEISKFFGDKLNMSPKQLDFVAKSYLGVLAQIGQPLATKQTYNTSDGMKEKLTSSTKNVLSRNFTADPLYNNDILSGFYNNKKKLDTAKNDYKKQDVKTADFNKQLQKQFTTGSEKISKKFDKIDKINANKELTASEKDAHIRSIRKEILDTAKKYNDKLKK